MSEPNDIIFLEAGDEAGRLWQGAVVVFDAAGQDLALLSESLDLGLVPSEIREAFPTLVSLVERPHR